MCSGPDRVGAVFVSNRLKHHSNEAWVAALRGEACDSTSLLDELAGYLRRVLGSTLSRRALRPEDVAELTQEAMLQLLGSLHPFREDCAFPTWAASVATRVAYTELRRKAAREDKHAAFRQAQSDALARTDPEVVLESTGERDRLIAQLHTAIDEELTERQRIATLALLRGIPTIEIAEQLGSNTNAIYKLVHDARLRLREALERRGVTAELLDDAIAGGEQ